MICSPTQRALPPDHDDACPLIGWRGATTSVSSTSRPGFFTAKGTNLTSDSYSVWVRGAPHQRLRPCSPYLEKFIEDEPSVFANFFPAYQHIAESSLIERGRLRHEHREDRSPLRSAAAGPGAVGQDHRPASPGG